MKPFRNRLLAAIRTLCCAPFALAVFIVLGSLETPAQDAEWRSSKEKFLQASRREHNARIETWNEVASWNFDDNRMPGGFSVLAGEWRIANGQLHAHGGEPMRSRVIQVGHCEWPAFRIEFDAKLESDDPANPERIGDIILGLNCDPETGSFARGYALLLAHYYNQATTCYRLNIPCARVEWSPIVPGRQHHIMIEVVKPHLRLWVDDRVALDVWERTGHNPRDYSDFLDMDPTKTLTLRTYDCTLSVDNLKISVPGQ